MGVNIKVEFSDEVSDKLMRLAKESEASLDRVLRSVSMRTKTYILAAQQSAFVQRSRGMEKATKYNKMSKARYRLQVHPRYKVHETGAYITPVNRKALMFHDRSGEQVFAMAVRIPKRPFFKKGLRQAIQADAVNQAAMASITEEFKRLGLE